MNKKLIALAVAGACAAPLAMAQTANPVTLYGRVYVTLESVQAKGGGAAQLPRRFRVEDQSSLLGVRGTEDIGGGNKVFFQLETAFRPDQNNTTFAARNSGVGIQGGWGSFVAGRWDMPFKSATIGIDPFGDLTIGGITGTLSDLGNFDRRDQNVVQYWSPNMGGFAFRLAATANEAKTADTNPRDFGGNLTYRKGPVYAFLAYEEHRDNGAVNEEKAYAVGGSFAFGPVKLGAQYQEIDKSTLSRDIENFMGNIVYTFGNNQLIYQYMQSENRSNASDSDCKSHHVGYQYNFSRRTFFLAQYSKVDNDDAGNCNFGANRLTISAGQELQGASVGLRHVF